MKKILNILRIITLIITITTSLVACNVLQECTPEKLKEENKIKTNNQEIRNNLEWIKPQVKPFNKIDNKWYYIIWRGDEKSDWRIVKFKNIKNLEENKRYNINKSNNGTLDMYHIKGEKNKLLVVYDNKRKLIIPWDNKFENGAFPPLKNWIKSVYRWNLNTKEPSLTIDNYGNVKVYGE